MEQRIGPNSQPLAAVAADPSHIPGLTAPVSVTKPEKQEEEPEEKTASAKEDASSEEPTPAPAEDDAADEIQEADDADDDADGDAEEVDGPVFEAEDRRARIVADHRGVRLRLDDQECEFRWDEIAAVETESPRFGKRFTVTVHTPDRRWFPIEIEAKAKSKHAEWETRIDEVLDAYFEDADEKKDIEDADEKKDVEGADEKKDVEESTP
ncbi:hypothetical protein [Streptomyces graminofaciens]|uniref:hypothetical protein n=1 Tax=Streptomyces graminofaciens TaxID=68212 RepID=UPI00257387E9|nr:hypothetical protein [Streptomyces graminofaciens]